jgi:adenylate kinase family enzyme
LEKTLLIFGLATTGKTTLSRKLVEDGKYDVVLENDDFWVAVSGRADAWNPKSNPKVDKMRVVKNIVCGICAAGIAKHYKLVVSGLWPGEAAPVMERLQDYEAVVLVVDEEEALRRWVERGNSESDFRDVFGDNWSSLYSSFEQLANDLAARGKLIDPESDTAKAIWDKTTVLYGGSHTQKPAGDSKEVEGREDSDLEVGS